ncbi:MAG: glutamine--fructose-6-phosphate transaminase (isomerizing), partial [Nitrospirota bacterium]
MCGIIGYIGNKEVVPILIEGLRRLEYRGYDSAGIAYLQNGRIEVRRSVGKLVNLEAALAGNGSSGRIGIGHTRWATHGRPSEENAHPHRVGPLVLVHNGIIENYLTLKHELQSEGRTFQSETDTEVIVHLMDRQMSRGKVFEEAVRSALKEIRGTYAVCVLSEKDPDVLIAARDGCPLVAGLADGQYFVASDIPAILNHTRDILFLDDGEMAVLTPKGIAVKDRAGRPKGKKIETVSGNPVMAERGGYQHFMLKEIHEQSQAVLDTFRGRVFLEKDEVVLPEVGLTAADMEGLSRLSLVACGTSWHAALIGKFMIEELARIPVEVDIGSEFRYRNPILDRHSLLVAISQSGETADTLAAVKEAKSKGARIVSICNGVGSTMARESNGVLYTHAGPEIGVAATKTFTAQLTALYLLAFQLGTARKTFSPSRATKLLKELHHLPRLIEETLKQEPAIQELARHFFKHRDFLYLGRGINYPVALEGALKLKELSYIHAEGYPAGEMKHGPIALIDENMPVVVLAPEDRVYEKVISNVMEVKARGGIIIAVATEGDREINTKTDHVIRIPSAPPLLTPIVLAIPMQLLAYHIAV